MANDNPKGSAKFWFEGSVASAIDNGTGPNATNNWIGTSSLWYQGKPQGYLQGGSGGPGESPENLIIYGYVVGAARGRAYAIIIY